MRSTNLLQNLSQTNSQACLVTGGAGFVGSHTVCGLLQQGYRVRVLDNLSTGKMQNILPYRNQIEWIEGDIRNPSSLKAACQGVEVVVHLAALASVTQSIQEPRLAHEINVEGTFNVLEAAREASVRKVVFASSAAVYGTTMALPLDEAAPLQPISPYGLNKLIGEQYCQMYAQQYGLETICFRYFNIYGPRQNANSQYSGVISTFFNTVISGKNPILYGDGRQSRDFVHVEDVVQANLKAVADQTVQFGIYNVASGNTYSVQELLDWLQHHSNHPFTIETLPERRGDIRHSKASIEKIKNELGFQPNKPFFDGLAELYQYVQQETLLPS